MKGLGITVWNMNWRTSIFTSFRLKKLLFAAISSLLCCTVVKAQSPLLWQDTPSLDSFAVQHFLSTDETLLIGMWGGGIQRTFDEGHTWWSSNNGLPQQEYFIRGFTQIGNTIFVATQNHGVWASTNEGASWQSASDTLLSPSTWSITSLGNRLFVGTTYGLFFSDNLGETWQKIALPLPRAASGLVFAMATYDQTVVACTNRYVYCSKDAGVTWEAVKVVEQADIVVATAVNGTFYIGTSGDGMYASNDGLNWE